MSRLENYLKNIDRVCIVSRTSNPEVLEKVLKIARDLKAQDPILDIQVASTLCHNETIPFTSHNELALEYATVCEARIEL